MRLPEPFTAQGDHIRVELPGAHVLFTTRRGGVSTGPYTSLNLGRLTGDDAGSVQANRQRVERMIGLPLAMIRQVHGRRVERVAAPPAPGEALAEADGQATADARIAPMVLVADCLPIAISAPGAVAVLHAGWRGLAEGVIEEGVRALRELGADGPLHAAIGPGAGRCCYEVGEEVHAHFPALGPGVRDGRNLDLKEIARLGLERSGVQAVHDVGLCTICGDPGLLFSHRRDRGITGRQAGIAWLS